MPSNEMSPPSADALEAAKERLTRVVQGDALRDVYPRGTQPSDFHADIRTLFSALGSEGEDSKRLDWLEAHHVQVRRPMRFGSDELFWAYAHPGEEHGDPDQPSDLRAKIDAALSTPGDANGQ